MSHVDASERLAALTKDEQLRAAVPEEVIVVEELRKRCGRMEANSDTNLRVERGEVFAFVDPNGACKTTSQPLRRSRLPQPFGTRNSPSR